MVSTTIENIVASTTLSSGFDLPVLASKLNVDDYDPTTFPGIIYNLEQPAVAFLILRSGKVVTTGYKSLKELRDAVGALVQKLTEAGANLDGNIELRIKDVVMSSDLGTELNLNALAVAFGVDLIEYVPEEFPGLVYRTEDRKVTLLIFRSGKIVCTGATKIDDATQAMERVTEEIRKAGLIE